MSSACPEAPSQSSSQPWRSPASPRPPRPRFTRHSKQQAESNLLVASKQLARWGVGLVDPKTKLLRDNTIAVCEGRGQPVRGRYPSFDCALHTGTVVVSVRYVAQRNGAFTIRKLRVQRR